MTNSPRSAPTPRVGDWTKRVRAARLITLALAVAAFVLLVIAGPCTRYDVCSWRVGLSILALAAYAGLVLAIVAALLLALAVVPRWRPGLALALVALCFALAALAPPMVLRAEARKVPPIHDISTDTDDPPAFVALLPERQKAPNGAAYGGPEIAAAQKRGYPDIKTLVVASKPADTMQRAIDAARAMGWQIAATDTAAGRIEATARTSWFGFRDDVVVRIRPQGDGSRVDVRSVSRVGRSDLGANARRVKEYLGRLA